MKKIKTFVLIFFGTVILQKSEAQTGASPFPLTEEQITTKIDSLRQIYSSYELRAFTSLSEAERNKVMIAKAKVAVLAYAPGYYREYKDPEILIDTVGRPRVSNRRYYVYSRKEEHAGKQVYVLRFPYDKTKENLGGVHSISVFAVLCDTGEPLQLNFALISTFVPFDLKPFDQVIRERVASGRRIEYKPLPADPMVRW